MGASGSCSIKAKDLVEGGTFAHVSDGTRFFPPQGADISTVGITPPALKSGLPSVMVAAASRAGIIAAISSPSAGLCAAAATSREGAPRRLCYHGGAMMGVGLH